MEEERLLKFIKQIENNLIICPKETEGAGNRSEMGGMGANHSRLGKRREGGMRCCSSYIRLT
ncbi:MAG: hypothetical protein AAB941_00045 [Patescibacteria group bacterium]